MLELGLGIPLRMCSCSIIGRTKDLSRKPSGIVRSRSNPERLDRMIDDGSITPRRTPISKRKICQLNCDYDTDQNSIVNYQDKIFRDIPTAWRALKDNKKVEIDTVARVISHLYCGNKNYVKGSLKEEAGNIVFWVKMRRDTYASISLPYNDEDEIKVAENQSEPTMNHLTLI